MIGNPFLDTNFCKDIKRSFIPKTMEMNNIKEVSFQYNESTKEYDIIIKKDDNIYQYGYKKYKRRDRRKKEKINYTESDYESNLDNIEYKPNDNILIQDTISKNKIVNIEQNFNENAKQDNDEDLQKDENIQDTTFNQFTNIDICKKYYSFMEEMCYNILNNNEIYSIHNFVINTLYNVRDYWVEQGIDISDLYDKSVNERGCQYDIKNSYINDDYCNKIFRLHNKLKKALLKKNINSVKSAFILLNKIDLIFLRFGFSI